MRLLDQGTLDFANPETFGYIKDRQHVAGFEPHRFSEVPDGKEGWKVQTLDLVGLLLEPEPRVYVSDKLPSMENVRAVPTRPLDKFESVGLLTLRDGEDLWIAREGNAARMIGAIREHPAVHRLPRRQSGRPARGLLVHAPTGGSQRNRPFASMTGWVAEGETHPPIALRGEPSTVRPVRRSDWNTASIIVCSWFVIRDDAGVRV